MDRKSLFALRDREALDFTLTPPPVKKNLMEATRESPNY
jgi:hypothetical protein